MSRSTGHLAYGVVMLLGMLLLACPATAAVVYQANGNSAAHPLLQTLTQISNANPTHPDRLGFVSIATSHDASDQHVPDFMQQITQIALPTWADLVLPQFARTQTRHDAVQLIGNDPEIRGNGPHSLPIDSNWMACCGDGTVLAAIDSSFRTLVNTAERQPHRSASLVSIAKTGTALPLSFEVSRRVRAQSVPEPASLSILGLAGLLMLRRPRKCRLVSKA